MIVKGNAGVIKVNFFVAGGIKIKQVNGKVAAANTITGVNGTGWGQKKCAPFGAHWLNCSAHPKQLHPG
jgi:hypothetical protein